MEGEEQGTGLVGMDGRKGGESVIWAPPPSSGPLLPQGIGVVVSFLEDFEVLLLSPGAHLEHSSPSKEVSQQLQKLLVERSPSIPENCFQLGFGGIRSLWIARE